MVGRRARKPAREGRAEEVGGAQGEVRRGALRVREGVGLVLGEGSKLGQTSQSGKMGQMSQMGQMGQMSQMGPDGSE